MAQIVASNLKGDAHVWYRSASSRTPGVSMRHHYPNIDYWDQQQETPERMGYNFTQSSWGQHKVTIGTRRDSVASDPGDPGHPAIPAGEELPDGTVAQAEIPAVAPREATAGVHGWSHVQPFQPILWQLFPHFVIFESSHTRFNWTEVGASKTTSLVVD